MVKKKPLKKSTLSPNFGKKAKSKKIFFRKKVITKVKNKEKSPPIKPVEGLFRTLSNSTFDPQESD